MGGVDVKKKSYLARDDLILPILHPREVPRTAHLESPQNLVKPLVLIPKVYSECWDSIFLTHMPLVHALLWGTRSLMEAHLQYC